MKRLFKSADELVGYVIRLIENATVNTEWQTIGRNTFVKYFKHKQCLILCKHPSKKNTESMWRYEVDVISRKINEVIGNGMVISKIRRVSPTELKLPGPNSYYSIKVFLGSGNHHGLTPQEIHKEIE